MKRIHIILLMVLCALLLGGCKGKSYKDIKVTSVRLVSIVPEGLADLTALIEVGVHNPTVAFEVTDLEGIARFQGEDALSVSADQLIVSGNSDKVYSIPLKGHISKGFNPFQLLKLLGKDASYDDITLSVKGKIALRGGLGKNIELKDVPLGSLLNKQEENEELPKE